MKSKKKLFEFLDQHFAVEEYVQHALSHPNIANETYGRKSCVYVHCGDERRKRLLDALYINDFKVDRSYGKDFGALEVQVSYFKGFHWYE